MVSKVKGDFASDEHYYDKDSGALVTNRFVHSMYDFFVDENGNRVTGQKILEVLGTTFHLHKSKTNLVLMAIIMIKKANELI